jgi:hypothetical protein
MELFIRLKNGQPFEHPILGDNFRQAFPDVDVNNLPEWAVKFVRVEYPTIGVYDVYDGVTYEWSGDVVTDVHHVRPMTDDEKLTKQNHVKSEWANGLNFASWSFDEPTCSFKSPVPYPTDGKNYTWDEATVSWVEAV